MAAQWESLDPNLVLLADVVPALRNAYLGQWQIHRRKFSYLLLAEIPYRAGNLVEDFDPDLGGLAFLVVDEYQDLNRADIRLLQLLAAKFAAPEPRKPAQRSGGGPGERRHG